MTPDLASSSALAMRKRHIRRKRVERATRIAYHLLAVLGMVFLLALTVGALPGRVGGASEDIRAICRDDGADDLAQQSSRIDVELALDLECVAIDQFR